MGVLPAGSLNQRITIQRRKAVLDAFNQESIEWVNHCSVFANIRTISGTSFISAEFQAANAEVSRASVSIRIRYRDDLRADMRVIHRGIIYEIRAVLPDLMNREFVDLGCAVGASEA